MPIVIFILFVLFVIFQYWIFEEMKDSLRMEMIGHVDRFMHEVYYRGIKEANRVSLLSDAQKLEQLERIITRLEELAQDDKTQEL